MVPHLNHFRVISKILNLMILGSFSLNNGIWETCFLIFILLIASFKYQLLVVGISSERRSASARPRIDQCAAHTRASPINSKETLENQRTQKADSTKSFIAVPHNGWSRRPWKQQWALSNLCVAIILVSVIIIWQADVSYTQIQP